MLKNFSQTKTIALVALAALLPLTACTSDSDKSPAEKASKPAPVVEYNPTIEFSSSSDNMKIDEKISFTVEDAGQDISEVKVRGERVGEQSKLEDKKLKLEGTLEDNVWTANTFLEPSAKYNIRVTFADGESITKAFNTMNLPLNKQTYPSVFPSKKSVVGQGQVIAVRFDLPVKDKASFEKNMKVEVTPAQEGSWHWINDNEARYRPKEYWKPGTQVNVKADVNSVSAGNGIYGQFNSSSNFTVSKLGRSAKVDLANHKLQAFENGKLVKTIPISAGKSGSDPGFITRSGTKIIMSKNRYVDMNSTSIGIDPSSSEGYDLSDVEYAMRLTNSGEFFHAAPWNAGSFGRVNASHGCIGSSIADSKWLYEFLEIGSPVEFVGSNRKMELDNGFGDWSISWDKYVKGSAL